MSRQKGSRNKRYYEERQRLAKLLYEELVRAGHSGASFRSLAQACDVSPATLRHYFENKTGALVAAVEYAGEQGEPFQQLVEKGEFGSLHESLVSLLRFLHFGWKHSELGELHKLGLGVGLSEQEVGPAYVKELLEPTLQAFEQRLQLHVDKGELRDCNIRYAAFSLLSPIFLAMLHQKTLSGQTERPLDIDDMLQEHVSHFIEAYQTEHNTNTPSAMSNGKSKQPQRVPSNGSTQARNGQK